MLFRSRSLVSEAEMHNVLSRAGYTDRAQGIITQLSQSLIGSGELLELHRRGELTDAELAQRMAALGLDARAQELLRNLIEYIPSAQDVVRFAVREVYTPAIAERFGQFEDFPDNAMGDFMRAGITNETARKYWASHWELPSVNLVFDM